MDRIFEANTSITPPVLPGAPATGYPRGSSIGVSPTIPGAYWHHMITESLRNVITAAGLDPDAADLTLLAQAMSALVTTGNADKVDGYHAADLWRFDASSGLKAENGWRVTPDGYMEAWGVVRDMDLDQTWHAVTLPDGFGAVWNVQLTIGRNAIISGAVAPLVRNLTTDGFEIAGDPDTDNSVGDVYWRVIGEASA